MNQIYILNELTCFDDGTIIEETLMACEDPEKLKKYAEEEFIITICVDNLTASYDLCSEGTSHLLITTLPLL